MKTILMATDLTARSDRALARALALGQAIGAEVHVLHVVDRGLPEALREHTLDWARTTMAHEVEACHGRAASCQAVAGKPRQDVVAHARALGADLIVLGLPDKDTRFRSAFADSSAGQILKSSHLPVLLASRPADEPYRNAVIGVDLSPYARAALRLAHKLAPQAAFHLVHAYQVAPRAHLASSEYREEMAHEEEHLLQQFLDQEMTLLDEHARSCGIAGAIERIVREGPPYQVLCDVCAEVRADLLAIGTHGRTGLARALFGSVAAALLDDPPCDVLVARVY